MHFGFLITGIISGFIWTNKCTGAIPTVTLTASSSPYFDIGGSISLTCSINGDVAINAAYLTKDSVPYVFIQIISPSSCESTPLTGKDPHVYSVTCEQRIKVHIVINGTVATDHNATWSCQMSSETQSGTCNLQPCISTSSVTTALRVPVSSVQLKDGTGQPLVTPVPVLDGSNKDFRCDTSPNGSRPRALFNWYKRSENQSPILIQDQSVSTPSPKPEVDLSMSISYSTLTLMGNRSYQNMYICCEARDETNRGNFVKSTEAQINIVYPPVVQLYPNTSVFNVTEGLSKFVFTCNVTDANPMPDNYSWFHGSNVIQGQTRSSYELLNVQKSQDGVYQCMARNNYGTGNSSTMYLNVQYGPTISLIDYAEVEEGENVIIACNVTANPQPDIVWSRNGTIILPWSDTLRIPYISRLNEGNYTCTASNVLYPTRQAPVSQMATDTLRISVLFGPGSSIYLTPNSSVYQVDEGQKAVDIICSATCNPACSYRWIKGNVQINNSNTLFLGIVQKNVTGNYSCEALNTIRGQRKGSNKSVEVIVRYGAKIINVSVVEGNTVNENTTATLRCLVDSNPESNITWTKQGIMGVLQTNLSVHESQLIIEHAECLDTSNYTCNARNGVGQHVERKVTLYVTCHPRTDFRSPPVTTVYSKRYGNASLNYTVISFPEPMFNWSFIGNGSESRSLPDSATKHDSGLQSVLIFTNININDFGFYRVIAKNKFPISATEVFQLIPADFPDIPSNVTVTDVKQTSLTVQWVAGYDGGLKQTFHIIIKASDITRSVYAPDPGYGKLGTQTIMDLIPNTEYSISMSANNSMGSSSVTNVIILITLKVPDTSSSPISAIAGGVAAGIVTILLVVIGIILWRRYQHNKKNLDGLVENPVYDSSDVRPGPLAEYATVDKTKNKAYHKEDPPDVYAQVNKTKKTKSGQKRKNSILIG